MIDKDCDICLGEGWVCEIHQDKPWREDGCMCSAGKNCVCNIDGDFPEGFTVLADKTINILN